MLFPDISLRQISSLIMFYLVTGTALAELPAVPVPVENPASKEKRVLGKMLFWEEQLSSDNTVACGSCHIISAGGSDPRVAIHPGSDLVYGTSDDTLGSPGIVALDENFLPVDDANFGYRQQVTGRASPGITMSMFAEDLFWDGRASTTFVNPLNSDEIIIGSGGGLESQAVGPILSSVEMAKTGRTWTDVTDKLETIVPLTLARNIPPDMAQALGISPGYPELFAKAFGDSEITPARIGMAIATYERTLVPDQTPWDLFMAGDESAMTQSQIDGWNDFSDRTVCDNCHVPPEFTDHIFYNIGLRPAEEDIGREAVTGDADDRGRFKTPTLRNVGLKQSLMHVGRITDTQDAIDFYNANADAENGLENPHVQFEEFQTGIPTNNPGNVVEYSTLSMFSNADNPERGKDLQRQIADFISNALTDPRVAAESFPFDRPTLGSELAALKIPTTAMGGAWINRSDNGEGWFVEITSNNQAVVSWYTYGADGNQLWLIGLGRIYENSISIDEMLITEGGIFAFPSAGLEIAVEVWGSLQMEFSGCQSATVTYQSELVSGSQDVIRLTALDALGCSS